MKHYDFIIAGGGISGLSLAYHLIRSPLRDRSMLIIDRDAKSRNDRTLCFWTDQPTLFDDVVYRSWDQLQFVGKDFEKVFDLGAYRYKMLRGIDFYQFVRQELSACANVDFLRGTVDRIDDGDAQAVVSVGGQTFSGTWVFDSRFKLARFKPDSANQHYLQQHFNGWEIETPHKVFDPQVATLFDLRTPQKRELRFFYVLPFSEHRALIECVFLSRDNYEQALKEYIEQTLRITDYQIVAEEGGVNPLTDHPFPRRVGQRVMTIGNRGGRVKPTSGYAFLRIQQDSEAIVRSLIDAGHPFDVPAGRRFYALCDSLMLEVMERHGEQMKALFTAMFKNNPIARIFRFLDERTSWGENLALMASMPPQWFLRALFRIKVWSRVSALHARRQQLQRD